MNTRRRANLYKYWGFISYSHKDESFVRPLHKALEAYRIPQKLVGLDVGGVVIPKRLLSIFRDVDELPASTDLGAVLKDSLDKARALIVICSPHSLASKWVLEEIRIYVSRHSFPKILYVVPPNAAFAIETNLRDLLQAATHDFQPQTTPEPLLIKFRGRKRDDRVSRLRLLAGLVGVSYDELYRRDQIRRRWRVVLGAALAALSLALFVIATVLVAAFGLEIGMGGGQMVVDENRTLERYAKEKMSSILSTAEAITSQDPTLSAKSKQRIEKIADDAAEYIYEIQCGQNPITQL